MKKIFITLFVLLIAAGTALTIVGFVKGGKIDKGAQWLTENKEIAAANDILYSINKVTIDADYADVTVEPFTEGMSAEYSYVCHYESIKDCTTYEFSCDETSGLRITQRVNARWFTLLPMPMPKITLYLPDTIETINTDGGASNLHVSGGSYNSLTISTAAGNVELSDNVDIKNGGSLDTTAGNIIINDAKIRGDIEVSAAAGNVKVIRSVIYDGITIDSTAGNIEIEQCEINGVIMNSASGNLKIIDTDIGSLNSEMTFGNIDIIGGNIKNGTITSTTGNCEIANASYAVNYHSGGELRKSYNADKSVNGTLNVHIYTGTFEFN